MNLEEDCFEYDLQVRFFFILILFLLSTVDNGSLLLNFLFFIVQVTWKKEELMIVKGKCCSCEILFAKSKEEKKEKGYQYSNRNMKLKKVIKQSIDSERSTSHIRHDTDVLTLITLRFCYR